MSFPIKLRLILDFHSRLAMLAFCFVASFLVLGVSLLVQWFVYDDWLHETGPLHILGSALAAGLTFALLYQRQRRVRERQAETIRQFETIARMNDRIRNALQAIECSTYVTNPQATEPVRASVEVIEAVLREALARFPRPRTTVSDEPDKIEAHRAVRKSA